MKDPARPVMTKGLSPKGKLWGQGKEGTKAGIGEKSRTA